MSTIAWIYLIGTVISATIIFLVYTKTHKSELVAAKIMSSLACGMIWPAFAVLLIADTILLYAEKAKKKNSADKTDTETVTKS